MIALMLSAAMSKHHVAFEMSRQAKHYDVRQNICNVVS